MRKSKLLRFQLLSLAFAFGLLSLPTYATPPEVIDQIIEGHYFRTDRTLAEYVGTFGTAFQQDLQKLGPNGHWLDSGAGEGAALAQFGDSRTASPKLTGVTYKSAFVGNHKVRILNGRYLEEIALDEIGLTDLITDFYGVMAYTKAPDVVLKQYLDLLKPGGVIYLFQGHFDEMRRQKVTIATGKTLPLAEWIRRIPDLHVELVSPDDSQLMSLRKLLAAYRLQGNDFPRLQAASLRITKRADQISVPSLVLIDAHVDRAGAGSPVPIRSFREN